MVAVGLGVVVGFRVFVVVVIVDVVGFGVAVVFSKGKDIENMNLVFV